LKDTTPSKINHALPISSDEWVNYFKSLLQSKGDNYDKLTDKELLDTQIPLDFPFTCKEVKNSIPAWKIHKKESTDLILNAFIKYGSGVILKTVVKLFNKILNVGVFPESWNLSLLSSIHKSGDPTDPDNYRGISVCSCMGKLFNRLLQKRLDNFF